MALNSANRTLERLCQCFHLGVALAGSVVGIVCKGAVGGDHLSGNAAGHKIGNLWDPGEFWFARHNNLQKVCDGALWCTIHQERRRPCEKTFPAAFSFLLQTRVAYPKILRHQERFSVSGGIEPLSVVSEALTEDSVGSGVGS